MKSSLYVIHDTKAQHTSEPFSCPNNEVAKRNFLFGCFASDTPPQDCILWKVGDYFVDDTDASAFGIKQDIKVCNPSVEEIEAYLKIYNQMHPDEGFEQFEEKGVIA